MTSRDAPAATPRQDFRKALLTQKIRNLAAGPAASRSGVQVKTDPAKRHAPFPLNDIQQAYWIGRDDFFEGGSVGIHGYFELDCSDLDLAAFEQAWNRLVARHEMLRAVVLEDGRQKILAADEVPPYRIEVQDLSDATEAVRRTALEETRAALSHERKDLTAWPQFTLRASIGLPEGRTRLHFSIDGWCLDGWSYQILFQDLRDFYEGRGADLPALEISFRDCVLGEAAPERDPEWQRDWAFWQERLPELPPAPELPTQPTPQPTPQPGAQPGEAQRAPRFAREQGELPGEAWSYLKEETARRGVSTAALMLSAYAAVLGRWSKDAAFTLNVPRFNRPQIHPDINRLVGQFSAFSLLPLDLRGLRSFGEVAAHVGQRLWENLEHPRVSGVSLLRELTRLAGGERRLMPVVFTTAPEHRVDGEWRTPVSELSALGDVVFSITQTPQVRLDSQYLDRPQGLTLFWEYLEGQFPEGMVAEMFGAYVGLLRWLAEEARNWDRPFDLLPRGQVERRAEVNATEVERPFETVLGAIARRVDSAPDATAVIDGTRRLTYQDLWTEARRLAGSLREALPLADGRQPPAIAVAVEKGWQQVVAVLACQLLGQPYVPLDPTQPVERLKEIIEDSAAAVLLCDPHSQIGNQAVPVLAVEGGGGRAGGGGGAGAVRSYEVGPDSLFNITYTSGSTGRPKGVMVTQAGMVNALAYTLERFGISARDRVLSVTPFHHDMAVFDTFGLLMAGGAVVMPERRAAKDPAQWLPLLDRERITLWNSVPAFFTLLRERVGEEGRCLRNLRLVFLGGDWIPLDHATWLGAVAGQARMVSVGGPTETTLWNIMYEVEGLEPAWPSIPYGYPISNTRYHVLDREMRPCPDWVPGVMYCEGVCVTRGYRGDPELTAEKYLAHPEDPSRRLYRTGDLGCYLPDGAIRFLGRDDDMLKVNGLRIEPAEIERQLERHPDVKGAVVVAREAKTRRRLHAYVESSPGGASPLWTEVSGEGPGGEAAWRALVEAGRRTAGQVETLPELEARETAAEIARLHGLACCAAFRASGLFAEAGQEHRVPEIAARVGIRPRYEKWLARALAGLVEDGLLERRDGGGYRCGAPLPDGVPEALYDRLRAKISGLFGYSEAQVDLLLAAARHLKALLSEEMHSAQLYASEEVPGVYARNFGSCNEILSAALGAAVDALGPERALSILEVGAGIGITTEFLVPHLPAERTRYVYTDLSDYFLQHAERTFTRLPRLETRLYDLEDDPLLEGFAAQEFDAVVASGVLHDTGSLRRTLQHLRSVLKPGGLMLVILPTKMLRLFDLSMGLQQGFDSFDDPELRQDHPLLPSRRWAELFKEEGYADCQVFEAPGSLADFMGFEALAARAAPLAEAFDPAALRDWLSQALPETMIPQDITALARFPLTGNGKVDRGRLSRSRSGPATSGAEGLPPQTPLQEMIAEVWTEVLRLESVGIQDNFFALGGDSLVATQILSRVKEQFGMDFSMAELFSDPTIKGMEDAVALKLSEAARGAS